MKRQIALKAGQFELDKDLFDSGLYCYKAKIDFMKDEIQLNIFLHDKEKDKLENHIDKIEDEINWVSDNMDYIKDEIKKSHLIDLKNDYWLEEGEKKITPKQFIKRIRLLIISFDIRNNEMVSTNLEYDDNDIFWGHRIGVDIKDRKVCRVEI